MFHTIIKVYLYFIHITKNESESYMKWDVQNTKYATHIDTHKTKYSEIKNKKKYTMYTFI